MYPQVFGKYVLERELSRGGMARVVLATLRGAGGFEKRLVVKQIRDELAYDQQFIRRFVAEAKTTVALSHPNIVPVYELGQEQGTYFLAMELVEGVSIAELLRERTESGTRRVLTPEEGAHIGAEVCRALDYAHRRMKVVHRDITPRNVMIDEEGQVKLIDFGIAAPALVAGQEILGSPGHMPPEQVQGKELGPATDIFALAVLLVEAWTGAAPFRRKTPEECNEAMRQKHPRPSDFDPRLLPLDAAIGRALNLEPSERQKDAEELGRELRNFLQGVDRADLARELGERVRRLREAAPSSRAPAVDASARPQSPSAGDMGTKTFAAREEALHWSEPPPPPPSSEGASTRKLDSQTPIMARPKIEDPAMSIPTPLMVEPVGDALAAASGGAPMTTLERAQKVAQRTARRAKANLEETQRSRRRAKVDIEKIATLSVETAAILSPDRASPRAPRTRFWMTLVLIGATAAGALVAWRARSNAAALEGKATPPASATATVTTAAVSATAIAAVSSSAPRRVPLPVTTAMPFGTGSLATSASTTEKAGRAFVTLFGEPGTRVSVDGVSRGACPVRVSLEPGQHEARFTFEPTGESRGERVSVKAGDRITVRAEFTGASPTIKIFR